MKDLLNEHKKYIIINIANEWIGTFSLNKDNLWKDAIKSMREIGIENAIMIDASGMVKKLDLLPKMLKKSLMQILIKILFSLIMFMLH